MKITFFIIIEQLLKSIGIIESNWEMIGEKLVLKLEKKRKQLRKNLIIPYRNPKLISRN